MSCLNVCFLLGAKGSRWSVIDDRPPISAIDQRLQ